MTPDELARRIVFPNTWPNVTASATCALCGQWHKCKTFPGKRRIELPERCENCGAVDVWRVSATNGDNLVTFDTTKPRQMPPKTENPTP